MSPTIRLARTLCCLLTVLLLAPITATAQQGDLTAEVLVEGSSGGQSMKLMMGADERLRMDMSGPQGNVSMVMKPEGMLMVLHPQRKYMEFTKEMLEGMRGMMGRVGQQQMAEVEEFDPESVTFEATGRSETINEMDAVEVAVHNSEDGKTSHLWMTQDAEIGLFEVFLRMSGPLSSMSMPGMQGDSNPMAKMQAMMQYARANGLPAGKVIRVVSEDSTMTLGSTSAEALGPGTWNAPDGYEKQQMPMMRQ